jgi:hypothetical protein
VNYSHSNRYPVVAARDGSRNREMTNTQTNPGNPLKLWLVLTRLAANRFQFRGGLGRCGLMNFAMNTTHVAAAGRTHLGLPSSQMNRPTRRPEFARHPHQVGEGIRFHFLHHLPAVCFHRDFADSELAANLLVQQPSDD